METSIEKRINKLWKVVITEKAKESKTGMKVIMCNKNAPKSNFDLRKLNVELINMKTE